ncbi:ammonia-forming cytochrome c nitrite reductase [Flammeovirga kamogawensis]|uniref:Cytochrome c-552 n=1 Tax=Flammeovirga kamogawensis TaxID=373891 RepID=A0ABX8H2R8_9BACT|nr:ammonia-forming cytochrome c nitrite reductase [Flammeovirga kamogawensis]MBB6460411.1 nitrite reductase (cytochrome c-552) [Flammeovirga kamogawensis]QWG10216.1 ammonia-forming cytochrome c nitrite reductase [Flammeovirga kamogawensis]TRX64669.1 ammonia-forming cytochrome c nitrite reductase [Flammeovirga kamogawensis]
MSSKLKNWLLFIATCLVVILLAMLGSNITERKSESQFAYQPQVKITEFEPRNEVWGENFPRQYQSFMKTKEMNFSTMLNGNQEKDILEDSPELVVLWAGYGFSKDYNAPRGHGYAIKDIRETLRTGGPTGPGTGPMPSTCWTCKSPDVPRLMNEIGISEFYAGKWADKGAEIVNPIGCADCHDNKTMALKISRPALIEAFESMGKDINDASHQEMRSLVCAQCHVEYYFNKKEPKKGVPYLTFPWANGMTVEGAEKYYDDMNFSDWTHSMSKTPMLKAQHPGYETYQQGIHAKRGVSCADCHMPYKTEGGQKFTDHHIQSPLANPANSCQVCHRQEEKELIENVYSNQRKVKERTKRLEKILVRTHVEAKKAWDLGATEAQMKPILMDIRHAQWRWDYAVASHGGSFHAPVEISRIVTTATDKAQEARIKLARLLADLGYDKEVPYPAIETKAKAQKYIGLDMPKLEKEKKTFEKNIIPKWLEQAKAREAKYPTESVSSK